MALWWPNPFVRTAHFVTPHGRIGSSCSISDSRSAGVSPEVANNAVYTISRRFESCTATSTLTVLSMLRLEWIERKVRQRRSRRKRSITMVKSTKASASGHQVLHSQILQHATSDDRPMARFRRKLLASRAATRISGTLQGSGLSRCSWLRSGPGDCDPR